VALILYVVYTVHCVTKTCRRTFAKLNYNMAEFSCFNCNRCGVTRLRNPSRCVKDLFRKNATLKSLET